MLRALRSRNYRLFFGWQIVVAHWHLAVHRGQPVGLSTAWPASAVSLLALMLGLVGFAGQIPVFLLTPLAGVWIDRWNRHRILIVTQTLSMLQSFALAGLVLSGRITIEQLARAELLSRARHGLRRARAAVVRRRDRRRSRRSEQCDRAQFFDGARRPAAWPGHRRAI